MQESTGTPSSCTVQAPQWPSLQATLVPVRPRSSRRVSASDCPTGGSPAWSSVPLTLSSSTGRHRQDVREVHEPKRRAAHHPLLALVVDLREHPPEVARGLDQLANLVLRLAVASRSSQALSARPSTPIVSACRVQRSGVAIERYWWIRAKAIGCENVSLPTGGVGSRGGSPAAIRLAVPESIARSWSSSSPASRAVRSAISSELGCCP